MRRWLTTGILLSAIAASAQIRQPAVPETPASLPEPTTSAELPDSPGAAQSQQESVVAVAESSFKATGNGAHHCGMFSAMNVIYVDPSRYGQLPKPCSELIYPYQRFLTSNIVVPMTWQQKGFLALHDLADPANFGTILGMSAITVGANSHSAYGPGLKGFGKIVGVSLLQDATAQFFGEFAGGMKQVVGILQRPGFAERSVTRPTRIAAGVASVFRRIGRALHPKLLQRVHGDQSLRSSQSGRSGK